MLHTTAISVADFLTEQFYLISRVYCEFDFTLKILPFMKCQLESLKHFNCTRSFVMQTREQTREQQIRRSQTKHCNGLKTNCNLTFKLNQQSLYFNSVLCVCIVLGSTFWCVFTKALSCLCNFKMFSVAWSNNNWVSINLRYLFLNRFSIFNRATWTKQGGQIYNSQF